VEYAKRRAEQQERYDKMKEERKEKVTRETERVGGAGGEEERKEKVASLTRDNDCSHKPKITEERKEKVTSLTRDNDYTNVVVVPTNQR
jgi:hypothetical protein